MYETLKQEIAKKQRQQLEAAARKEKFKLDFNKITNHIHQKQERVVALNDQLENLNKDYESLNSLLAKQGNLEKFL